MCGYLEHAARGQIPRSWLRDAAFHVSQEIPSYETKMLRRIALRRTEKMSPQAEGMLQNTSGGTLSGDFSPKKKHISGEKHTENPPEPLFCNPTFLLRSRAFKYRKRKQQEARLGKRFQKIDKEEIYGKYKV